MGRTALEMALRDAGVGVDVSIALAAELSEVWAGDGDTVEDGQAPAFALHLLEAWEVDAVDHDRDWHLPAAVDDANVGGASGDLCGRRVA